MMRARLARPLLVLALVAITVLALMPQATVPVTTLWDKSDHLLAFFVLGVLAGHAFSSLPFATRLAPALLGYGALLELAQSLTPSRVGSIADLVADLVGLLLAGLWLRWRRSRSVGRSVVTEVSR